MLSKLSTFQLKFHFYKIICPEDHETEYFKNISCSIVKNINGSSAIFGHADLLLPMTVMNFHAKLIHKVSNSYYLDFKFEYCNGFGNFAPLINIIVDSVKKYSKNLVRSCPYPPNISMELLNLPSDMFSSVLSIVPIPRGDYIFNVDLFDQNKKRFYYFSLYISLSQKKGRKKV